MMTIIIRPMVWLQLLLLLFGLIIIDRNNNRIITINAFRINIASYKHEPNRLMIHKSNLQYNQKVGHNRMFSLFSSSSSTQPSSSSSSSSSSTLLSPVITIDQLTCTHDGGVTYQLNDASYILQRYSKVGLVGRNGCGKSTLLKIILSEIAKSSSMVSSSIIDTSESASLMKYTGTITSPRDVRIAYVEQEPPMYENVTVSDAIFGMTSSSSSSTTITNTKSSTSSLDVFDTVRRYRQAMIHADENPEEFINASSDMDEINGCWDIFNKCDDIATQLYLHNIMSKQLIYCSGGERKRIALATALIQQPDVILLDEPTNYLSFDAVQWLTNILISSKSSIFMVTHDRTFLNDVCDRIVELDNGKLYEYNNKNDKIDTNQPIFDYYLQARDERYLLEDAALQSVKAKFKIEQDWMRRQPQGRQTKAKSRIDSFGDLQQSMKSATASTRRPNALNIQKEDIQNRRIGNKILSMRNVTLTFSNDNDNRNDDETSTSIPTNNRKMMLDNFSYDFWKGDKLCLCGTNGVGKTTFVRLLTGEQKPDNGIIEIGDTIVLGIYDQLGIKIDISNQDKTVLQYVRESYWDNVMKQKGNSNVGGGGDSTTSTSSSGSGSGSGSNNEKSMDEARKLLKQFEFSKERWNERLCVLSGGEKRRLQLLSVITLNPNFLILDEPSTDLDVFTLEALEDYLTNIYTGVLLIVTHDRYFADKVADHLFVFEGNGIIKDYQCTLSEYFSELIESKRINKNSNDNTMKSIKQNDRVIDTSIDQVQNQKEDKMKRNEQRNIIRNAKKEINKIESEMEILKVKTKQLQKDIDNHTNDKGWSALADLTDQINQVTTKMENYELRWMELAEIVENEEENE